MIEYIFKEEEIFKDKKKYTDWLENVVKSEGYSLGEICYIFTDDDYLLKMNKEYLDHDYYTDIITFDYTSGKQLSGDIFISFERIEENAKEYDIDSLTECRRVMVHGILHLMGHKDDTERDKAIMTSVEDKKLKLFHVEHKGNV